MPELTAESIIENSPRMDLETKFNFGCGPDRACFNSCCRDVSILLSPYDVLRLKNALHMNSSEFLEKYTLTLRSKDKQIPVVLLRMDDETRTCPFVTGSGCSVYAHRPWACRMYPLGMAEPKGPNAAAGRFYFLVEEQLCKGHGAGCEHSVREWIDSQKLDSFDQMQAPFLELMSHPGWEAAEPMSQKKLAMYFMSLYDLDRFRRFVMETRFLELFEVDEARMEALATDDEDLLELAIDWLAYSLFHEKRMKLKTQVVVSEPSGAAMSSASQSPG